MKVSELLQGIPCTGTYNDVEVLDVTQDSRLVEPGYLFVCIKGASFDGHAVAAEMLEKGAVAVVCDHDMGLPSQDYPQYPGCLCNHLCQLLRQPGREVAADRPYRHQRQNHHHIPH